jgi:hypothetical protein
LRYQYFSFGKLGLTTLSSVLPGVYYSVLGRKRLEAHPWVHQHTSSQWPLFIMDASEAHFSGCLKPYFPISSE